MSIRLMAKELKPKLSEIRRNIHANPELGFEEYQTAELIIEFLDKLGITYKKGIARTGIVATLNGSKDGKSILIRADMDALPIQEKNDVSYKSKISGIMHACGHDAHVACLLGAAALLKNLNQDFPGTIHLLFQPAEETSKLLNPEGSGGALPMINEGIPSYNAALALHIGNLQPVGKITITDGPVVAGVDDIEFTIRGKGGHAARPHQAIDPVFIASHIYVTLQAYLNRYVDPMEDYVFTIGQIIGGDRQNIISETCFMTGTLRTMSKTLRKDLRQKIPEVARGIAESLGGKLDYKVKVGYPVGINSSKMNNYVRKAMMDLYGAENIVENPKGSLGGEDFFDFSLDGNIPVTMFRLGGGNSKKGFTASNHSNIFDFDEDALPIGAAILAQSALLYLND